MNVATYMSQVAQRVGCIYVPKCSTFKDQYQHNLKGAAFGVRKGYLLTLACTQAGRSSGFAVLVRYPKSAAGPQIQEALKNRPGFSTFFGKKNVKAAPDGVLVTWPFSLSKTKLEDLVSLVDAVIEEVGKSTAAFDGKCEDCGAADAKEIVLMNGLPGYHCSACQMRVAAEKQREADEYKARDANYVVGLAAGLAAAAIAGSAWGWAIGLMEGDTGKWSPKLHAIMAFLVSVPVCWLIFKAMGKRDRAGQAMAIALTLAAKWWGDSIYFTHVVMHAEELAFSWPLAGNVLRHFFDYKFYDGWHILVTVTDVVAAFCIPWMPWAALPKFMPVFQTINPDGTLTQTLTQGALN
ncbi:MAG TPA: hypothetical protein VNW97_05235 [Candidatus Saccharimonadales bacterium]|jgi:hypothetical protein|nr:hypothetical protein [Candidatus Saccharimonadales bacterium]